MCRSLLEISREPIRLGWSGLAVFPLAWGCWRMAGTSVASAREKLEAALDAGIDLIDTADIYGLDSVGFGACEQLLGRVLREAPRLRERIVLATKCGIDPGVPYDSSPDYIRKACDASLARLGVDTIDLYQIHRPDLLAHPASVADTLAQLRRSGKIREVGVSNYSAAQFEALQAHLDVPIATHQPELSPWCLDALRDGVLDQCMRLRVTPLAWSPLAGGKLGLSPDEAATQPDGARLAALLATLDRLAAATGAPRSAVALAFVLAHPSRPVAIIGTQQPARISESLRAFDVELSRSDWYDIVEASQGAPLP